MTSEKPQTVHWLPTVPSDWDVRATRWLCQITTGESDTQDAQDTGKYPFYVRSQTVQNSNKYIFDGEGVLTSGDGAGVAKIFHHAHGKFDFHQRVYLYFDFKGITGRFFFYYLSSHLKYEALAGNAKSTVDSLRRPMLANLPCVVPPLETQRRIAAFLDRKTAAIDDLIAKKQRLIELLEEKRAALINRVVTKGLNPDAPMKDSGVPWIGDIPAHWEIGRNKYKLREHTKLAESDGYELLSVSHITGVTKRSDKQNVTMFKSESQVGYKICDPNDIVINTMWAWMGALGVVPIRGVVSPAYSVYRSLDNINVQYMELLLKSRRYIGYMASMSTGIRSSRLRLYPETFGRLYSPSPPMKEQLQIKAALLQEINHKDRLTTELTRANDLMREYRQALITAAVTGQIDVDNDPTSDDPEEMVQQQASLF